MRRISSKSTLFYKWLVPVVWFGILTFFLISVLAVPKLGGIPVSFIFVPVVMAVFGYFVFKKLLWDLADQVVDAGDALVVRFGRKEERIPLANISNVSYAYLMNSPRVTLMLRIPGQFGKEVSFAPPKSFIPWRKNPEIMELMERVDAARQSAMR